MATPHIDFHQIRTHGESQQGGFEELCCQLARLDDLSRGSEFYRKGSGGDAGVECYCKLPNNDEIGWQAKYLFEWNASTESQLDKSIRAALKKHPKLKSYIVCLPFDLPDARRKDAKSASKKWNEWKEKWIEQAKKEGRTVDIALWGKHELSERLSRDAADFAGRLLYWFNARQLTQEWFSNKFEIAKAALGSRYTPETNIELPIRTAFLYHARGRELEKEIEKWIFQVHDDSRWIASRLEALDSEGNATRLRATFSESIKNLIAALKLAPTDAAEEVPIDSWMDTVKSALNVCNEVRSWIYNNPEKENAKPYENTPRREAEHFLFQVYGVLHDIESALKHSRWRLVNANAILLEGAAGTGKSHLLADIVEHQLQNRHLGIMIPGSVFVEGDPWRQILDYLDISADTSVEHFLSALSAAGEARRSKVLFCVDAINERNGINIWPARLAAFLTAARRFKYVSIVLSCRTTYVPVIIDEALFEHDLSTITHRGFLDSENHAADLYLGKRGIIRPGAPNLVPEFNNPLFLKTCCDALDKQGKKELPRGLRGITSIFKFYRDAVASSLNKTLRLDSRYQIIEKAISSIATAITQSDDGFIDRGKAIKLLEEIRPSKGDVSDSLLSQLENEGVLTLEPVKQEDGNFVESVRFTFERFSDHAIARRYFDQYLDTKNVRGSFLDGEVLADYIFGSENYKHAGVIEAMAIQLPELTGEELPDVGTGKNDWIVIEAFVESVLWREQDRVSDRTLELLRLHRSDWDVSAILISITTEPDNKFNANYIHSRLANRTLADRDKSWSVFLAQQGYDGPVETLISWAMQSGIGEVEGERASLAATTLCWFLTTSNRQVRDKATKALAGIMAPRLGLGSELFEKFKDVNDPYVLERLLAAIYGAALQGLDQDNLGQLCKTVYDKFFAQGMPPPDALLRDHAKGLFDYTEWRGALPCEIDEAVYSPPYKSDWPIEQVPDSITESFTHAYKDDGEKFPDAIVSSTVNEGDFQRYQITNTIDKWSVAPIGTDPLPTERQVFEDWLAKFTSQASEAENKAFRDVVEACIKVGNDYTYTKTPEKVAREQAFQEFQSLLGEIRWEEFRTNIKSYVQFGYDDKRLAKFNVSWGCRWICKRAHDLGWTAEDFKEIEQNNFRGGGRNEHRIERIGKKYQWIALRELVARLSDNLSYVGTFWERENGIIAYEGARQLGLRDIDPSLIVERTHYEGWGEWGYTWWVPFAPELRSIKPQSRLDWLQNDVDIVNDESLIEVTNPKSGRKWLALYGSAHWAQYGLSDWSKEIERQVWCHVSCVVIKKVNLKKFVSGLKKKPLRSSRALPQIDLHSDFYLGEHPWHPALAEYDAWATEADFKPLPSAARATVAHYSCSDGGYDYSIDKTIGLNLPAPWLAKALGLSLSNGQRLEYVDENGRCVFFDPSTTEAGPSAALVDRSAFLEMLDREELSAVWVIHSEKNAYSGVRSGHGFGGRSEHTGIYHYEDGHLIKHFYIEHIAPTAEQLKEFLDESGD